MTRKYQKTEKKKSQNKQI